MRSDRRFEIGGRYGVVVLPLLAPGKTRIDDGHIFGSHGSRTINENAWKEAPHVALANLPTYDEQGKRITRPVPGLRLDPQLAQQFVRTYGGFRDAYQDGGIFDQGIAQMAKNQETLRREWLFAPPRMSDVDRVAHAQEALRWDNRGDHFGVWVFGPNPLGTYGHTRGPTEILLTTDDMWKFIRYFFLRDCSARKTGVCGNPDCPAPYYLKGRSSQKYCDLSPCMEYAHRQHALKWWRETGQKRRAKKRGKSPRNKGK